MKRSAFAILFLALAAGGLAAQSVDYDAVIRKVDDQSNFKNTDFFVTITLVTEKVDGQKEAREVKLFRRDRDDQFLMIVNKPEVERGQGYLKAGDNMWFYDPSTREFSHTSLKERFSSSNANNDDFAQSSLVDDYKVVSGKAGKLGKSDVHVITLEAKKKTATYPMLRLFITQKDNLLLQQEEYSATKKLMRTSLYTDYRRIDGRAVPFKQLFIDNLTDDPKTEKVEAERTQMTMSDLSLSAIPDEVFTQGYLERVSN